jgi:glycosyltransferase involved in cell wall biosynthesis
MGKDFLSIIICVYNMPREAPRTILSALPPYQKNVQRNEYEVIIVDNGSSQPIDAHFLNGLPEMVTYVQYPGIAVSPVFALNWAAANVAKGNQIMFCIDGARMFSEGVVAECLKYAAYNQRSFVHTLAWHLGPDVHMRAAQTGYNQEVEDRLLEQIDWYNHPSRLFESSVFAGSSSFGFFSCISESNAFVVSKDLLATIGGYDERFTSPGGGLCNLEIFSRYVTSPEVFPICLLGNGTFHQYHGGIATSGLVDRDMFRTEYQSIFGKWYQVPKYSTMLAGGLRKEAYTFYVESLQKWNGSV